MKTEEDSFKLNASLLALAKPTTDNAGTAIAKGFTDIGKILEGYGAAKTEAKEKEALAEIRDIQAKTAKIDLGRIVAESEDENLATKFIASKYTDLDTYLKDTNSKFSTAKWAGEAKKISDTNYIKMYDESVKGHVKYLTENNLFQNEDGTVNMPEVRKQLAQDPNNIHLSAAFERAYGINLHKPDFQEKTYNLNVQQFEENKERYTNDNIYKKGRDIIEDKQEWARINKGSQGGGTVSTATNPTVEQFALQELVEGYKEAYGKPITATALIQYQKDGKLPFKLYGQDGSDKEQKLIARHLEFSKDIAEVKNIIARNPAALENISGLKHGNFVSRFVDQTLGRDSADAVRLRAILGKMNSVENHELFGAALTGKESSKAFVWDLDQIKDASVLKNTINVLEEKNKLAYSLSKTGYVGVPALYEPKNIVTQPVEKKGQNLQTYTPANTTQQKPQQSRTVVKEGMYNGKKVIQYSDGTIEYAK